MLQVFYCRDEFERSKNDSVRNFKCQWSLEVTGHWILRFKFYLQWYRSKTLEYERKIYLLSYSKIKKNGQFSQLLVNATTLFRLTVYSLFYSPLQIRIELVGSWSLLKLVSILSSIFFTHHTNKFIAVYSNY
jgi:hypothetical protein